MTTVTHTAYIVIPDAVHPLPCHTIPYNKAYQPASHVAKVKRSIHKARSSHSLQYHLRLLIIVVEHITRILLVSVRSKST
jgi:uncharacterized membrane protein